MAMIQIQEFFYCEKEAIKFKEKMYRDYHPAGYGTHLRIISPQNYNNNDHMWMVIGTRYSSCD